MVLERVMDTNADFRVWLEDFVERRGLPWQAWLVRRLERAQALQTRSRKITVRGPLGLGVLKKLDIR